MSSAIKVKSNVNLVSGLMSSSIFPDKLPFNVSLLQSIKKKMITKNQAQLLKPETIVSTQ